MSERTPLQKYEEIVAGLPRAPEVAQAALPHHEINRLYRELMDAGDIETFKRYHDLCVAQAEAANPADPAEGEGGYGALSHASTYAQGLCDAAAHGHLPLMDYLLDTVDPEGFTSDQLRKVVSCAAGARQRGVLEHLQERGIDVIGDGRDAAGMGAAGLAGHLDIIKFFTELGPGGVAVAAHNAAKNGHLEAYSYLMEAHPHAYESVYAVLAATGGHIPLLTYVLPQVRSQSTKDYILHKAGDAGQLGAVKFMVENGADMHYEGGSTLMRAAGYGHLAVVEYLLPESTQEEKDRALRVAAENNKVECVKALYEQGADPRADIGGGTASYKAAYYQAWPVVSYFYTQGVELETDRAYDQQVFDNIKLWHKRFKVCPVGLETHVPFYHRPVAFAALTSMLECEGYTHEAGNRYAYNAAVLFGTADRALAYLRRWGKAGRQPLHDIVQHIAVPHGKFNNAAWADAVLRHGPKMARLVKFADMMPEPEKDPIGQWSYMRTRAVIAMNAYARGAENPELAALCFELDWKNAEFEAALKLVQAYEPKQGKRIPAVTIDGAAFGKPGYKFSKLPDGDPRGLLLGEFTNCCQHLAGAGSDCAEHGYTSPHGGFYVIEEEKSGAIVAQSWAWRGKGNELVLDSLEALGGHMNAPQWKSLCAEFTAQAQKTVDVAAINIGRGGATPSLGLDEALPAAVPVDYTGYRDSKEQYVLWTRQP